MPKWCRALIYDVVVPEAGFEPGPPYGDELAESAKIIQGHFWDWVGEARRVIHLDLHTGLGDHGKKPPDSTVSGHIPVPGEIDGVPCIGIGIGIGEGNV